jgi:FkbM family methyltransferase
MSTSEPTKQAQWQTVYGYILGNQAAWIATIGVTTGLFQAIFDAGEAGIREESLAEQQGYHLRPIQVWCRAAYAFELLDWEEQTGYRLAPHMASLLLDTADPQYLGGRLQFFTALYEDYRAFPQYLQKGEIWPRSAHEPFLIEALKNLTKGDCVMITEQVLPQAPATLARLESGGQILDIGAGGGHHAIHYARRFPQAQVVALEFDLPSVELARKTVAEAGMADRVEIRYGDANELAEQNSFDLITMNISLHETGGPDEYRNVLRRVQQALKPGATVMVSELPYPDSPTAYREQPVYKGLAGVQLHEAIVGCGMITQNQLRMLLEEGQFADVRVAQQSVPTRVVMLGEKPTQ